MKEKNRLRIIKICWILCLVIGVSFWSMANQTHNFSSFIPYAVVSLLFIMFSVFLFLVNKPMR